MLNVKCSMQKYACLNSQMESWRNHDYWNEKEIFAKGTNRNNDRAKRKGGDVWRNAYCLLN